MSEVSIEDRLLDAIEGEPAPEVTEEAPQTPSEALDEALDNIIGDDEGLEESVLEEPTEPQESPLELVEVEYDGVVYEVPETLKGALMMQSDYTQKTQSVAEQRKEIEVQAKQIKVQQEEQKFIGDIQPELNNIGYLQATIQQMENDLQSNLSNMTSEDMFRKKIEVDGYKEQLNALSQGLQAKYKDFEEAQKQSYQELLNEGAQVLKQAIPDWSEAKQAEVRDYALKQGFSPQEVSSIIDPRHVKILWAAAQYESLKEKASPVSAQAKKTGTIQPKGRPQKMDQAAKKRLAQNKIRKAKGLSNADRADKLMDTAIDKFL